MYEPSAKDLRRSALRQIRLRRGQQSFRQELCNRYQDRCAISGCTLVHLLEAAHISPYLGDDDNHPNNGLLLRTDLHTLFDLDLLAIDPDTLQVRIHASVDDAEYRRFDGVALGRPNRGDVSKAALRARWQRFGH